MRPASDNTGRGADTRRFVDGLSGAVARSNITPTKNTSRPSRPRSRNARTTRRARRATVALYKDAGATLDDLRESVRTFGELEPISRRVLGGAHPTTAGIEYELRDARAALAARKQPSHEEEDK